MNKVPALKSAQGKKQIQRTMCLVWFPRELVRNQPPPLFDHSHRSLFLVTHIKDITTGHIIGSGCYNDIVELLLVDERDYSSEKNKKKCTTRNTKNNPRGAIGMVITSCCQNDDTQSLTFTKPSSSSKYVVKRLRGDLSSSTRTDGALALASEAKLLQKLHHPHIISMHSLGNNMGEKDFFIIIERLDIDLARQIQLWKGEEAKLSLSKSRSKAAKRKMLKSSLYERIDIAYQVVSALFYLHEYK